MLVAKVWHNLMMSKNYMVFSNWWGALYLVHMQVCRDKCCTSKIACSTRTASPNPHIRSCRQTDRLSRCYCNNVITTMVTYLQQKRQTTISAREPGIKETVRLRARTPFQKHSQSQEVKSYVHTYVGVELKELQTRRWCMLQEYFSHLWCCCVEPCLYKVCVCLGRELRIDCTTAVQAYAIFFMHLSGYPTTQEYSSIHCTYC